MMNKSPVRCRVRFSSECACATRSSSSATSRVVRACSGGNMTGSVQGICSPFTYCCSPLALHQGLQGPNLAEIRSPSRMGFGQRLPAYCSPLILLISPPAKIIAFCRGLSCNRVLQVKRLVRFFTGITVFPASTSLRMSLSSISSSRSKRS